jgi:tetratricopeptide (TPR) repeat protein
LDKKNSEALVKLGVVQHERGATDQALQTYLDGSKINPKEITFYLLSGGIYESKQDWDHAKQQYQKVLEIQPENPLASNNLAYVMQQGGNVDIAFGWRRPPGASFPMAKPPIRWAGLTRNMSIRQPLTCSKKL